MKKGILQKGLTMIELMAVITMVIIVTSVVFANYGTGQESLALERSTQKLYQDLRYAISESMSGVDSPNVGVGVHFDKSTTTLQTRYIIYKNSTPISFSDGDPLNIFPSKTIAAADWEKLEDGVKVSYLRTATGTSQDTLDVFFLSPYPHTFLDGDYFKDYNSGSCIGSQCEIVIMLSTNDGTRTKTITVNNSGMINIQ